MGLLSFLDLRWFTGAMLIAMGLSLLGIGLRVWWMPLAKRAEIFGPLLTDKGFRQLFIAWPMVFVLGLFLAVCGVSKVVYWGRWQGVVAGEFANGVGIVEALFAAWTAGSLFLLLVRAWRAG